MPQRLVINPRHASLADLAPAARVLLDGGLVAGPTGSFYALMATADNPTGLERIQKLKGERENKPLLLLLDQPLRALCYARETGATADALAKAFWPGPLTLILPAHQGLAAPLLSAARSVGLRVETLPAIRRLVRLVDRGLSGTSANPTGAKPAVTADEVEDYFGSELDLIIDGGQSSGGLGSSIVDCSSQPPWLLRAGDLPSEAIKALCPELRLRAEVKT